MCNKPTTQTWEIGDCIELMRKRAAGSIDTIVTSPPYWGLRDYNVEGQIGLESTLEEYHNRLLEVTAECMRVLKPIGVMFWDHGDSYGGNQGRGTGKGNEHEQMISQKNTAPKCLTMQNERLIIRMIDEQGWILRNRIIWSKPNGMPSSVTDRFANKYEPIYMLVKGNDTNYYCNRKTGAMQWEKPFGTTGEEGADWDWKAVTSEDCSTGEVSTERKKVSNWRGHDYWFDLDAVRVPAKYGEVWSRKGAGKDTPYAQNNPRSRWGQTKKEITSRRKKFDNDMGGAGSGFKGHSGSCKPDGTPLNHPLGKNPGDVRELTQVEWMDYCHDLYDMFAEEPGDIIRIPTQPYPESHFATFPTALIEPLITAACPAEICPVCGMPRERLIDREFVPQQDVSAENGVRGALDQKPMDKSNKWQGVPRGTTAVTAAGWTSCNCGSDDWIAGTVLDPFCGSGTVLEVCRLLNRNAIGFDLNPEYEPMIKERSMSHTPPLTVY